jgi:hypothetical protein
VINPFSRGQTAAELSRRCEGATAVLGSLDLNALMKFAILGFYDFLVISIGNPKYPCVCAYPFLLLSLRSAFALEFVVLGSYYVSYLDY